MWTAIFAIISSLEPIPSWREVSDDGDDDDDDDEDDDDEDDDDDDDDDEMNLL